MKRLLLLLAVLTLVYTGVGIAQTYEWQHIGVFPPAGFAPKDTIFPIDIHGLAVDPAGKVWIQRYGAAAADSILIPNYMNDKDTVAGVDSIISRYVAVRALHIYNPNGTEVSFSPIFFAKGSGFSDTLGGASVYVKGKKVWHPSISPNTGRGLRADQNGNIIASYFGNLYRFNYQTGAAMAKGLLDANNSGVAVGVSQDGYIYDNLVSCEKQPLKIFNPDLTFLQNAVDSLKGLFGGALSRAINVSKDGNDIYFSGWTNHCVIRYHSDFGVLGSYLTRVDTVMKGFDAESFCWNPKRNELWASSGSFSDLPNRWPGLSTSYATAAWYPYNPTNNTVGTEKIQWVFYAPSNANERPRAIAFSPGGDTAYVGVFGGSGGAGVRAYRRVVTSVETLDNTVPGEYTLSQNYPNPFNPSTEIQFTIPKGGLTSLMVYDILGREVATLVNENLAPGTFKTRLDGARLSSGSYFYTLVSGDTRITKKMMLLK